jgi:hypothetical protein
MSVPRIIYNTLFVFCSLFTGVKTAFLDIPQAGQGTFAITLKLFSNKLPWSRGEQ